MSSLSIKVSNGNRFLGPKSSQRLILRDSHLIFGRTQLLAAEESLLCDCIMVDDYILEINLTKRQKIIHFLNQCLLRCLK